VNFLTRPMRFLVNAWRKAQWDDAEAEGTASCDFTFGDKTG
jgi:hypothetical protein